MEALVQGPQGAEPSHLTFLFLQQSQARWMIFVASVGGVGALDEDASMTVALSAREAAAGRP